MLKKSWLVSVGILAAAPALAANEKFVHEIIPLFDSNNVIPTIILGSEGTRLPDDQRYYLERRIGNQSWTRKREITNSDLSIGYIKGEPILMDDKPVYISYRIASQNSSNVIGPFIGNVMEPYMVEAPSIQYKDVHRLSPVLAESVKKAINNGFIDWAANALSQIHLLSVKKQTTAWDRATINMHLSETKWGHHGNRDTETGWKYGHAVSKCMGSNLESFNPATQTNSLVAGICPTLDTDYRGSTRMILRIGGTYNLPNGGSLDMTQRIEKHQLTNRSMKSIFHDKIFEQNESLHFLYRNDGKVDVTSVKNAGIGKDDIKGIDIPDVGKASLKPILVSIDNNNTADLPIYLGLLGNQYKEASFTKGKCHGSNPKNDTCAQYTATLDDYRSVEGKLMKSYEVALDNGSGNKPSTSELEDALNAGGNFSTLMGMVKNANNDTQLLTDLNQLKAGDYVKILSLQDNSYVGSTKSNSHMSTHEGGRGQLFKILRMNSENHIVLNHVLTGLNVNDWRDFGSSHKVTTTSGPLGWYKLVDQSNREPGAYYIENVGNRHNWWVGGNHWIWGDGWDINRNNLFKIEKASSDRQRRSFASLYFDVADDGRVGLSKAIPGTNPQMSLSTVDDLVDFKDLGNIKLSPKATETVIDSLMVHDQGKIIPINNPTKELNKSGGFVDNGDRFVYLDSTLNRATKIQADDGQSFSPLDRRFINHGRTSVIDILAEDTGIKVGH